MRKPTHEIKVRFVVCFGTPILSHTKRDQNGAPSTPPKNEGMSTEKGPFQKGK